MTEEHEVYICPKDYPLTVNADRRSVSSTNCEQFQSFDSTTKWKWGYNIPVFGQSTVGYNPPSRKKQGEINQDATFYKIFQEASGRYGDPIKCTSFITNSSRNAKFKLGTDENSVCQIKNYY